MDAYGQFLYTRVGGSIGLLLLAEFFLIFIIRYVHTSIANALLEVVPTVSAKGYLLSWGLHNLAAEQTKEEVATTIPNVSANNGGSHRKESTGATTRGARSMTTDRSSVNSRSTSPSAVTSTTGATSNRSGRTTATRSITSVTSAEMSPSTTDVTTKTSGSGKSSQRTATDVTNTSQGGDTLQIPLPRRKQLKLKKPWHVLRSASTPKQSVLATSTMFNSDANESDLTTATGPSRDVSATPSKSDMLSERPGEKTSTQALNGSRLGVKLKTVRNQPAISSTSPELPIRNHTNPIYAEIIPPPLPPGHPTGPFVPKPRPEPRNRPPDPSPRTMDQTVKQSSSRTYEEIAPPTLPPRPPMIADDNIYLELIPNESNSGGRQMTAQGNQMTKSTQRNVPAPPGSLPRKPDNGTIPGENIYEEIPYNLNSGKRFSTQGVQQTDRADRQTAPVAPPRPLTQLPRQAQSSPIPGDNTYLELLPQSSNSAEKQATIPKEQLADLSKRAVPAPPMPQQSQNTKSIPGDNIYEKIPYNSSPGKSVSAQRIADLTVRTVPVLPTPSTQLPRQPQNKTTPADNLYEEIPYDLNVGKRVSTQGALYANANQSSNRGFPHEYRAATTYSQNSQWSASNISSVSS